MSITQSIDEVTLSSPTINPSGERESWKILPVSTLPTESSRRLALQLNSMGSFYYFCKVILRKNKLVNHLHRDLMCSVIEKTHVKDVIEIPRGHYKTTIYSEGAPMWWALPFEAEHEDTCKKLGYSDEFIRYMYSVHDRDTRTLIASGTQDNATKIGSRIGQHYESNDMFQKVFPTILPDETCQWNKLSMTHKRSGRTQDGEGTFDFIGVGAALQSRHYKRAVQDDLVGKEDLNSDLNMDATIDYHRLLPGAFDRDVVENDELVVGNRWAYNDLNSYIRENEPWFSFQSHSAIGGCCKHHPINKVIFPEIFTWQILEQERIRFGDYYFSCQYLNNPTLPGQAFFNTDKLRKYQYAILDDGSKRVTIKHHVANGEVLKDMMPANLQRVMIVDPAHADAIKKTGRCRHAIVVVGYYRTENNQIRIYLLESWAEETTYDKFVKNIYEIAKKWNMREFYLETIAAQGYLKLYLEHRNNTENIKLRIRELNTQRTANAKALRIESVAPFINDGHVWVHDGLRQQNFISELNQYPHGKTVDIIDCFGYFKDIIKYGMSDRMFQAMLGSRLLNSDSVARGASAITGY